MCGVAGVTHPNRLVGAERIRRATLSLLHRGPDQQGIYESANISPSSIRRQEKIGLDIPADEWFRGVLRPLLLDTLTADAVEKTQLFRWDAVQSLIRNHLERRANLGYHLWGLVTLFLWMKRWGIQTKPVVKERHERWACVLTPS